MKPTMTVISAGKVWKLPNGKYHREDGPAIVFADSAKDWYINGKFIYGEEPND